MVAKIGWEVFEGVFIVVSTAGDVDDSDWNNLLSDLKHSRVKTYFAVALGSTNVNPFQRKAVANMVQEKGMNARVVTDSSLTRGLVTAVSWFVPGIKSFSTTNLSRAIESVGLTDSKMISFGLLVEKLIGKYSQEAA